MTIWIDTIKSIRQNTTVFHDNTTQQNGNRKKLPQLAKGHSKIKPELTSYLMVKVGYFPPKIRKKTRISALITSVNTVLEALAGPSGKKEIKLI